MKVLHCHSTKAAFREGGVQGQVGLGVVSECTERSLHWEVPSRAQQAGRQFGKQVSPPVPGGMKAA